MSAVVQSPLWNWEEYQYVALLILDHRCQPSMKVSLISTSTPGGATCWTQTNGLPWPQQNWPRKTLYRLPGTCLRSTRCDHSLERYSCSERPPWSTIKNPKESCARTVGHEYHTEDNEKTEQLEGTAWTSTLQAVAKASTSVRGLARIAGRKNISLPAGKITTVDAMGYWGSLSGEEGGILAELLRDKTHHGLIIASTLTSVCGKHVKLQVANDLLVYVKLHICNWMICSQYIIAQKAVFINSVIF